MINIIKLIKVKTCRHNSETENVSCPFTGNTYTYCKKCETKLKVAKTV